MLSYIDVEELLADDIFIQENIRVRFGKVGRQQGSQYVVVLCKVWKWEEEKFVCAMKLLQNKMLLLGHVGCINFFDELGIKE